MKRFLLLATMFAAVLSVNAQRRMQVWERNTYMQFFTTDVDSVTFLQFHDGILQKCEEIHDTIIKTMTVHDTITQTIRDTVTKTIKDTVYVKDTIYINKCGSQGQGVFSVSVDKQVSFSRGNLQYQASTKIWRFAENQYDYIGSDNSNISDTCTGWIDLFGWSGSTATAQWGISTSSDHDDYSGDFVDWGTNTIGTDASNTWRTLSKDEWYYIFYIRTNAQKLFGLGSINGVNGTIILPDNWTTPIGVTFTPSTEKGLNDQDGNYYDNPDGDNYTNNTYTLSDWQKMESTGAVFLPAAGFRLWNGVHHAQYKGHYWSSTIAEIRWQYSPYILYFYNSHLSPLDDFDRSLGASVRLVQDL